MYYIGEQYIPQLNVLDTHKFKPVERDMDEAIYERSFTGRMTKQRYKILDRLCRANSFRRYCGHEYDCCGCLCSQSMSFEYKRNQVVITLTQNFNY